MKKLRVVQVGTWVYTHADDTMLTMRNMPEYYEIAGVCEPNADRKKVAMTRPAYQGLQWLDMDEVLADNTLDAVIVETHELEQARTALIFAENGFNIHMEKPGGENYEDFERLIHTVKRRNIVFQTGYMYRYNPAIRYALELVRQGRIGDIICTEAHMSTRYGYTMLQWLSEFQGGMMLYIGCHLVDLLYSIQGKPDEVIPFNTSTGLEGSASKDYGFVLFRYKSGISFIKTTASEMGGHMRRQVVISGTKGTIEIKPTENPVKVPQILYANDVRILIRYAKGNTEEAAFGPFGRYDDMMLDFAKIVSHQKQNEFTPDHELAVFKLIMRACGVLQ